MTEEEKEKHKSELEEIIDRFKMTERCGLTKEDILHRVDVAMVCANLAHTLTDAANSLLMDADDALRPMKVCFTQKEKFYYGKMLECLAQAKRWSERSSLELYGRQDADDFAADADWWYNMVRLIDDRTGDDDRKSQMLLEWLLNMPSQMHIFDNIKIEDFKRFSEEVLT